MSNITSYKVLKVYKYKTQVSTVQLIELEFFFYIKKTIARSKLTTKIKSNLQ